MEHFKVVWTSVDIRLPSPKVDPVLVRTKSADWGWTEHYVATLVRDEDRPPYWVLDLPMDYEGKDIEVPDVTHWSPLPIE